MYWLHIASDGIQCMLLVEIAAFHMKQFSAHRYSWPGSPSRCCVLSKLKKISFVFEFQLVLCYLYFNWTFLIGFFLAFFHSIGSIARLQSSMSELKWLHFQVYEQRAKELVLCSLFMDVVPGMAWPEITNGLLWNIFTWDASLLVNSILLFGCWLVLCFRFQEYRMSIENIPKRF